jgi:type III pantothenate kinase
MQSGLIIGYVAMIEGMIERFQKDMQDELKIIATGGLSELIASQTKKINFIAPWLTLEGLRIIWEINQT